MPSSLSARAASLIGVALDRREIPLNLDQWPEFRAMLHPTTAELLAIHWPLRAPDRFHLNVFSVREIATDEVGHWLLMHGWLLVATGPDGSFITCSNDGDLRVTYVSMQESMYLMNEGFARPKDESVSATPLDIFDLLSALDWMSRKSVEGVFPEHLEPPIPLDFYEAKGWDFSSPRNPGHD